MPPDAALADARGGADDRRTWDREDPHLRPTPPEAAPHNDCEIVRSLSVCAALVRDRDWPAVRDRYLAHRFRPLAILSGAVADGLVFFEPPDVSPGLVLAIAARDHRPALADLFHTFGLEP